MTSSDEPATCALKSCPASWYEPPITWAMMTPTFPLKRWYPSAIAATSPSCLPTTKRLSPSSAVAAEMPVSAGPGLVERYSAPPSSRGAGGVRHRIWRVPSEAYGQSQIAEETLRMNHFLGRECAHEETTPTQTAAG